MVNKIQHQGLSRTLYTYSNNSIYGVMVIFTEKTENISKHDIILIIFKWRVSEIYLRLLIPNLQCTYDQINQVNKCIRYLY